MADATLKQSCKSRIFDIYVDIEPMFNIQKFDIIIFIFISHNAT